MKRMASQIGSKKIYFKTVLSFLMPCFFEKDLWNLHAIYGMIKGLLHIKVYNGPFPFQRIISEMLEGEKEYVN